MKSFTKVFSIVSLLLVVACSKQVAEQAPVAQTPAPVEATPVATPVAAPAPAASNQSSWKIDEGHVFTQYFLETPSATLMVHCATPDDKNSPEYSEIRLIDKMSQQAYTSFKIKFGNDVTEGPINAESMVGEDQFLFVLNKLRTHASFEVIINGRPVTFSSDNKETLPNSKDRPKFFCKTENNN